jgi:hypothetical protein
MARLGSIAAAPFLGDQFVSLYVGATRVPTVPGPPTVDSATGSSGQSVVEVTTSTNDGGSDLVAIRYYVNGQFSGELPDPVVGFNNADEVIVSVEAGDEVRAAAVNGVGEGPLSAPTIATT